MSRCCRRRATLAGEAGGRRSMTAGGCWTPSSTSSAGASPGRRYGGVPAGQDGLWTVPPLGPGRGVAAVARRPTRPSPGRRRTIAAAHRGVIDSASVRGADTVPTVSRGYDAGKRVNGRKRHLAVDTTGLLLAVVVTVAGIQDRDGACRLLAALRAKFSTITLTWARRRLRRTTGHLGQGGAGLHRHDRQAHRRPGAAPANLCPVSRH